MNGHLECNGPRFNALSMLCQCVDLTFRVFGPIFRMRLEGVAKRLHERCKTSFRQSFFFAYGQTLLYR